MCLSGRSEVDLHTPVRGGKWDERRDVEGRAVGVWWEPVSGGDGESLRRCGDDGVVGGDVRVPGRSRSSCGSESSPCCGGRCPRSSRFWPRVALLKAIPPSLSVMIITAAEKPEMWKSDEKDLCLVVKNRDLSSSGQ